MCDTLHAPPLRPQPSPLIPVLLALLAFGVAISNLLAISAYYSSSSSSAAHAAPPTPPPASGLLGSARHLASAVLFTAPTSAASATASAASAGGVRLNPTVASVSEPAGVRGGWLGAVAAYGLGPALFGAGLLFLVVRHGKHLVNKPQLCPKLAATVSAKGGKGGRPEGKKQA